MNLRSGRSCAPDLNNTGENLNLGPESNTQPTRLPYLPDDIWLQIFQKLCIHERYLSDLSHDILVAVCDDVGSSMYIFLLLYTISLVSPAGSLGSVVGSLHAVYTAYTALLRFKSRSCQLEKCCHGLKPINGKRGVKANKCLSWGTCHILHALCYLSSEIDHFAAIRDSGRSQNDYQSSLLDVQLPFKLLFTT